MRTSQTKVPKAEKTVLLKWIKPLLIGTIVFFGCFLILLLIFSVLMMNRDFSDSTLFTISCISLALAAFVGGYTASRISKEKGLIIGGGTGLFSYFLLAVFGTLFTQSGFGTIGFIKLLLCLLPAGIGGFFGVNRKKRRK